MLVQQRGSRVNEVRAVLAQGGVVRQVIGVHAVKSGVAAHANVEVGVSQPRGRVTDVGHCAQHNLGV
jgi:hypothetical protein